MIGEVRDIGRKESLSRQYFLGRVFLFYRDGFRSMTWGRTLWLILLLKLFFMFAILKVFFFPDFLKGKSEVEKQDFVGDELVGRGRLDPVGNESWEYRLPSTPGTVDH